MPPNPPPDNPPDPQEPVAPTLRRRSLEDADDETARKARPSVVTLARGTQVGRYLLLDLLGEGGMGAVYAAYDPDLGRKVAVKLLKPGDEAPEVARARLLREAQAMARLSHPNVVPVYDTGLFDGQVFVAMELVEGETLHRWLEQKRSPREILQVIEAAGDGLAAAHGAGLVHRDFKPDNVLIGKDGRVRVTDFGLALLEAKAAAAPPPVDADLALRSGSGPSSGPVTEAGTILGTPAYMAPEQFLGEPATARSDQFAFCVALWEALCGGHPYAEKVDDFRSLGNAVLLGKLRAPARPLPRGLHRVLSQGLSRQPADRYATMAELLAALRRDPMLRLRRAAAPAAVALGLLAAVSPLALQLREESHRCRREAEGGLEAIWGGERRAKVSAALAANAGLPAAEIVAELDRKLRAWAALRREVCEAGRVGQAQEGLRNDRECLEQYGVRAALIVEALADSVGPESPVAGLLHRLDPPVYCRGVARRPTAAARRPPDLVREAERIDLLLDLGQTKDAVERARALLPEAKERGALSVASDLQMSIGRGLNILNGPSDEALQTLRQAVRDADAAGDDQMSFDARLELSLSLDGSWLKPAEALDTALDAQAWLERLGRPPLLEQLLQRCQASALSTLGRHEEAVALFRKAAEASERLGLSDADRAGALNDLGAALSIEGRWAEAEPELEKAVALFEKARWLSMADLFTTYVNLGLMRTELGRPEEGLAEMERGKAVGERHPELANWSVWSDAHRARVLLDLGRLADAEAAAKAVLERPAELDVVSHARAQACLARVRAAQGSAAEALELAQQARSGDPGTNRLLTWDIHFALAAAARSAGRPPAEVRSEVEAAQRAYPGGADSPRRKAMERWLAGDGPPSGGN